jgi:hypothetical protein
MRLVIMKKSFAIMIVIAIWGMHPLRAQFADPVESKADSTARQGDFSIFDESNKNTFRVLFSGNPGRAALYSLVLPGAGQYYNKRYWKIPIVYGALGGVGYLFWSANSSYQDAKDIYIANIETSLANTYFVLYQDAKKSREQAIFAIIGVYLFNVFDAYIDRHLIDFDMSEDLSFKLKPYGDHMSPLGLTLAYSF